MRYEINSSTGEVTEHADAPVVPVPPPTPAELLQRLDAENMLTQRNLRETVMFMSEAFKTLSGGALDLSQIPGVEKVFSVEAQAEILRTQL